MSTFFNLSARFSRMNLTNPFVTEEFTLDGLLLGEPTFMDPGTTTTADSSASSDRPLR